MVGKYSTIVLPENTKIFKLQMTLIKSSEFLEQKQILVSDGVNFQNVHSPNRSKYLTCSHDIISDI